MNDKTIKLHRKKINEFCKLTGNRKPKKVFYARDKTELACVFVIASNCFDRALKLIEKNPSTKNFLDKVYLIDVIPKNTKRLKNDFNSAFAYFIQQIKAEKDNQTKALRDSTKAEFKVTEEKDLMNKFESLMTDFILEDTKRNYPEQFAKNEMEKLKKSESYFTLKNEELEKKLQTAFMVGGVYQYYYQNLFKIFECFIPCEDVWFVVPRLTKQVS